MFNNGSIMSLSNAKDGKLVINRLDIDQETQGLICATFSNAVAELLSGKEKIVFDGSYTPSEGEYLSIASYSIDIKIKEAVKNPLGLQAYQKVEGEFPEVKALFIGEYTESNNIEHYIIAFQKFKKDQYISTSRINLFFENNTFHEEKRFGISISPFVDCVYNDGELQFSSFYYARQIFDLNEYYRLATDGEVQNFANCSTLVIQDSELFKKQADSWVRRKVAMINDSKVLENNTATKIKQIGKKVGISINISDGKVVIPTDKAEMKKFLGFLDEEVYKGPFSDNSYMANSKRKI